MVAYIIIILLSSDNLQTFCLPASVSYHLQPQDFLLRSFVFLEYFVHKGKVKKKGKKLTSVSFMYVCVAEIAELLLFFAPSP